MSIEDQIQNHSPLSNSHGSSSEVEFLDSQDIASPAYSVEDVIASHVEDQIPAGSTGHGEKSSIWLLDLLKAMVEIYSMKRNVMKVEVQKWLEDLQFTHLIAATSSRPLTIRKIATVRVDDEMIKLLEMLTGQQYPSRHIIPIVGMGGTCKTSLAKNDCENR